MFIVQELLMSLKAEYITSFVMIYLLNRKLTLLFYFSR
jgi:hypothetical protein